uniref:Uncharacterized protein n=1 Tax=Anabas testudineus TaxID=64144 RepID=A0A7N6AD03_ANATE
MTPLKMWCLLPHAVLLLLSITPTETEVVTEMAKCEGFLLNETPPQTTGILEAGRIQDQNRYRVICQTYNDTRRFVTLYDTVNRIPVFSAYKYRGGQTGGRRPPWKIEPQVYSETNTQFRPCQASNADYDNDPQYNRGHLFPFSYGFETSEKHSTCTLTNAVPQDKSFNSGSWERMESSVKSFLKKYCINNNDIIEAYIVTGAKPSKDKMLNGRVNIPSVLWSAFCCYSKNENNWLASAHWGNNDNTNGRLVKCIKITINYYCNLDLHINL